MKEREKKKFLTERRITIHAGQNSKKCLLCCCCCYFFSSGWNICIFGSSSENIQHFRKYSSFFKLISDEQLVLSVLSSTGAEEECNAFPNDVPIIYEFKTNPFTRRSFVERAIIINFCTAIWIDAFDFVSSPLRWCGEYECFWQLFSISDWIILPSRHPHPFILPFLRAIKPQTKIQIDELTNQLKYATEYWMVMWFGLLCIITFSPYSECGQSKWNCF